MEEFSNILSNVVLVMILIACCVAFAISWGEIRRDKKWEARKKEVREKYSTKARGE